MLTLEEVKVKKLNWGRKDPLQIKDMWALMILMQQKHVNYSKLNLVDHK